MSKQAQPKARTAAPKQAPAAKAPQVAAAPASPLPTPATPTPAAAAPAPTVALRGGQAVQAVQLTGKAYRTAAPHNQQWWKVISAAAGAGPVAVAGLLASPANPQGVPAHFVGYALRRGYLQAATL